MVLDVLHVDDVVQAVLRKRVVLSLGWIYHCLSSPASILLKNIEEEGLAHETDH